MVQKVPIDRDEPGAGPKFSRDVALITWGGILDGFVGDISQLDLCTWIIRSSLFLHLLTPKLPVKEASIM